MARAYEVLRDPSKRKLYDSDKAANRSHTTTNNSSNYDYDQTQDQGRSQGHRTKRTANPGSHTAYSEFYKSYGAEQSSSANEKYEYTGTWQDYYNSQRAEENMRQKYYQEPKAEQRNQSFFDSIIVRMGLVMGFFLVFDIFRNQKTAGSTSGKDQARDPKSLGQMDWGTQYAGEMMSPQKIQEEMQRKQFRIEYHVIETNVSPEAVRARKAYKKEKKIVDLDEYMEKKNFRMEKSRAQYAV